MDISYLEHCEKRIIASKVLCRIPICTLKRCYQTQACRYFIPHKIHHAEIQGLLAAVLWLPALSYWGSVQACSLQSALGPLYLLHLIQYRQSSWGLCYIFIQHSRRMVASPKSVAVAICLCFSVFLRLSSLDHYSTLQLHSLPFSSHTESQMSPAKSCYIFLLASTIVDGSIPASPWVYTHAIFSSSSCFMDRVPPSGT